MVMPDSLPFSRVQAVLNRCSAMFRGTDPISKSVQFHPNAVKALREAKKWKQFDLQIEASVSLSSVRRAETGKVVNRATAEAIGKALGVDYRDYSVTLGSEDQLWLKPINLYIDHSEYPVYLFTRDHIVQRSNKPTEDLLDGASIVGLHHKEVDGIFRRVVHKTYKDNWVEMQDYYEWRMDSECPPPPTLHHPTFFDRRGETNPNRRYNKALLKANISLTVLDSYGLLCIIALTPAMESEIQALDASATLPYHQDNIPVDSEYWKRPKDQER
jgi:transcriptional regulator with XRE-family HTH domain